jgi:hypothetical protein
LSPAFGEYFGFTEEEVAKALEHYNLEHKADAVNRWYNGYIFGKANVYNPWSIIKYLFDARNDPDWLFCPYWVNTSSNSIVRELIDMADDELKEEIETLIRGESITKRIREDVVYSEIKRNVENLWNFLFFTGYLKNTSKKVCEKDESKIFFDLEIPNIELRYVYTQMIREWFNEKVKTTDLNVLYTAILNADSKTFEDELSLLLSETISYHDSQESFYHGFLTGVLSRMKGYRVKSNRESGKGRGDIFLLPTSMRNAAVIIEIKPAKTFKDLEKTCTEALDQIETKKYDSGLIDEGYAKIIKYGAAFFRKDLHGGVRPDREKEI